MLQKTALLIFILTLSFNAQSQNTIYSYTFESDLESWQSKSLSNQGFWSWSSNGKADQGVYWNNRPSIDETSNGALVYDGDYIINSNIGDTLSNYRTVVISPTLDFSAYSEVFIKFNQYYRNYDSNTSLEISSDLGLTWNTIDLNTGVNSNVETSAKDYEIIDISAYAANELRVQVRFLIDGRYYFWLLDDIFFYDGHPVVPTIPSYIGEYLTLHGYPYEVDDAGWPYVPNEGIVNFAPGTPESVKEELREEVGAILKETCVCNTLETWTFVDDLLEGGIGLSSNGTTTGANEQLSTSNSASEIDETGLNKYVKGDLTVGPFGQPDIEEILEAHKPPKGEAPLKIGIIDTGIDILHDGLDNVLFQSFETPYDEIDDDENCYADNYVGWNFVDDNNNASDDQGHGSHVAGIIAKNTKQFHKKGKIQLIPYKTHDQKGLANLFDVTCAMYLSIKDKVSVVNCSWGFFGNESEVLNAAIFQAYKYNITVVAAVGNDAIYLVDSPQYPACTKLPNIISVGSYNYDKLGKHVVNSSFSNYSSKYVDVLAPGVNILSTVPYNDFDYKTGTSMAAPAVAGIAAEKYLMGYSSPVEIKASILHDALDHDHLKFEVLDGNVLLNTHFGTVPNNSNQSGNIVSPEIQNISTRDELGLNEMDATLRILNQQISMQFQKNYSKVKIYLYTIHGQRILSKEYENVHKGGIETIEIGDLPSGLYILRANEKNYEFAVY